MLSRVIRKIQWADNSIISSLMKVVYYNIIKVNRFVIFELDLKQELENLFPVRKDYDIQVIDYEDLAKAIDGKKNLPREFDMHEIDGVKHCVLIKGEGQLGHISWIYLKGDKDRWFNLDNDEAHINYSFTFPEFRGMALFPQALLFAAKWLKSRNYRRILMDVHEETVFMLNSMNKIKQVKRVGTLTHWFFYRPKYRKDVSE